jgi:hypothetical protein
MPLQSFDRIASRIEYVNVETLLRRLQHSLATDMPIVVTQRCLRGTWMSVREPPMCVHRRKQMEVLVTICERKIYCSYFQYHGGLYHALHLLRSTHQQFTSRHKALSDRHKTVAIGVSTIL